MKQMSHIRQYSNILLDYRASVSKTLISTNTSVDCIVGLHFAEETVVVSTSHPLAGLSSDYAELTTQSGSKVVSLGSFHSILYSCIGVLFPLYSDPTGYSSVHVPPLYIQNTSLPESYAFAAWPRAALIPDCCSPLSHVAKEITYESLCGQQSARDAVPLSM